MVLGVVWAIARLLNNITKSKMYLIEHIPFRVIFIRESTIQDGMTREIVAGTPSWQVARCPILRFFLAKGGQPSPFIPHAEGLRLDGQSPQVLDTVN
jgi:hypothetical protein